MIYCFQHPDYKGQDAPQISCKTCCHLFIQEVKRCRDTGEPMPVGVFGQPSEKTDTRSEFGLKAQRFAGQGVRNVHHIRRSVNGHAFKSSR